MRFPDRRFFQKTFRAAESKAAAPLVGVAAHAAASWRTIRPPLNPKRSATLGTRLT
jgi:hypothetical protein